MRYKALRWTFSANFDDESKARRGVVRTSREVRNWENWVREDVRDLADVVGRRARGVWNISVVHSG